MRIVFLCNEYPPCASPGGIGVFTHTIAHGLVAAGHQVTVLGYGRNNVEWKDGGVRVVVLAQTMTRGVAWFVNRRRLYSWLKRHCLAKEIDIIETPEYQGMMPFKFPWCPVVVRLHTSFLAESRLQYILEHRTLKIHRNWIAVSDWIGRETEKKFNLRPTRLSVVYNSVTIPVVDGTSPLELPDHYVLYAGTVRESKGAVVLAEAARSFLAPNPDLHLVYVGGVTVENGRRADETIRQVLGDQFSERVHFTGPVEHELVLACMKKARVFAFPSKLEAFSLVPLEAMGCGVPVVYSTLHSGPEAIDDGVTGLLADPYSPSDVAKKVLLLLNDTGFAARLAKDGKQAVKERFSLNPCVDKTVAFYKTVSPLQENRLN